MSSGLCVEFDDSESRLKFLIEGIPCAFLDLCLAGRDRKCDIRGVDIHDPLHRILTNRLLRHDVLDLCKAASAWPDRTECDKHQRPV